MFSPDNQQLLPLVAALQDGIIPDGQGGYVPVSNSRVAPDGSLYSLPPVRLPASMSIYGRDEQTPSPSAPNPQLPSLAPGGYDVAQAGPPTSLATPRAAAPMPSPEDVTPLGAPLNPHQQALKQQYDIAHTMWEAASRRAAAAAANPNLVHAAKVYQDSANQAMKMANDYVGGYIETLKTPAPPQTASPGQGVLNQKTGEYEVKIPQLPPQTASPGQGILNPQTGKYDVPIPKDDKINQPSEVQEYQFDQKNRGENGLPPISYSDFRLQKKLSLAGGAGELLGKDGQPLDPNLTGPAVLETVPPAVANHARALLETREQWPTGFAQARNPQLQQALAAAQAADRGLDQTKFAARQAMRRDVESGNGRINLANVANNTALNHSDSLATAIVNLSNTNTGFVNSIVNSMAPHLGFAGQSAVNKADAVKQFNTTRDALSNELEKSFHGVGSTAEQAVKRQIDNLDTSDPPQVQLGALMAAQQLLAGKIGVNEENYRITMGEHGVAAWEKEHNRPFGFVTSEASRAAARVEALYNSVKAGHGFQEAGGIPAVQAMPSSTGTGPPPPAVGTVKEGYRFIGGNPADRNSWRQVQ